MVYDPIRDCDVPSPAIQRRPSLWESPQASSHQPTYSPEPSPGVRPLSGPGMRSLLNDDAPGPSRRGSDLTAALSDHEEHGQTARPHLSKLLNDTPTINRRTSSSSSIHQHETTASSPRLSSPTVGLHPGSLSRVSTHRSPLMPEARLSSPSSAVSTGHYELPPAFGDRPSSRRSSFDVSSRSMPPPSEPIRHELTTPTSHSAPLRSPSMSASPGSHSIGLPQPRVSRSNSGTSSSRPPPRSTWSPEPNHSRRASDEVPRSPSSASNGRRSPPPPSRTPYEPRQPSGSRTIRQPITHDELQRLRTEAASNNPLRRNKRRSVPSVPSWSAPSPQRGSSFDATAEAGPSHPQSRGPSRRGSNASATSRPDVVPQKRSSKDMEALDDRATQRRRQDYTGNAAEVASHYNSRPEVGVEHREFSPIIGLKKFNNWIKSVLIGKFAYRERGRPGAKVLDLGAGKGGDLNKWKQARIDLYVAMDIAETSMDQARDRWQTMRGNKFEAYFYPFDCFSNPISEILPSGLKRANLYDNVSMQFCMHYAFETASKARMMIENVSRYLRRGGVFIGTIPNSEQLLDRLEDIPEGEDLRFGNSCYEIAFDEREHKGVYGHRYRFFLQDAVEDVPEYIVDWDNFVNLAREYGLELIYRKTFNDVLQEEQEDREFSQLLTRMGVVNQDGESAMDGDQWEAANLYMAFAFEKVR